MKWKYSIKIEELKKDYTGFGGLFDIESFLNHPSILELGLSRSYEIIKTILSHRYWFSFKYHQTKRDPKHKHTLEEKRKSNKEVIKKDIINFKLNEIDECEVTIETTEVYGGNLITDITVERSYISFSIKSVFTLKTTKKK